MPRDALQIHSRVIAQVRFRQGTCNCSAQRDGKGQADNRFGLNAIEGDSVELFFLRGRETPILCCPARVVGRESELGALRKDFELAEQILLWDEVSKSSSVVIGAEVQFDFSVGRGGLPERNNHLVVMVARLARLASHDGIGLVVRVTMHTGDFLARSPSATLAEFQRERGILDYRLVLKRDIVSWGLSGGQTENDLHGSIRRRQLQRPGRNSSGGKGSVEKNDENKAQQISGFAHDLSRSISNIVRDLPMGSRRVAIILLIFVGSPAMCGIGQRFRNCLGKWLESGGDCRGFGFGQIRGVPLRSPDCRRGKQEG